MAKAAGKERAAEILNTEAAALAGVSETLAGLIADSNEAANTLGVIQDRVDLMNERLSALAMRIPSVK